MSDQVPLSARAGQTVRVVYTNWRGETKTRVVVPARMFFGATEYHTEEQWLLDCWDVEKNLPRTFSLKDCDFTVREVRDRVQV